MVDLGDGLEWCNNCNVGWTDEDDLDDAADEPVLHALEGSSCSCGEWTAALGTSIWRGFDRHLIAVREGTLPE